MGVLFLNNMNLSIDSLLRTCAPGEKTIKKQSLEPLIAVLVASGGWKAKENLERVVTK